MPVPSCSSFEHAGGVRPEHGADDVGHLVEEVVERRALERPAPEPSDRGLLFDIALELGLRGAQPLAGDVERARGLADLGLEGVVAVGHGAHLVLRPHEHGHRDLAGVRLLEVAAGKGLHRAGEIGHRAARQLAGGVRDLLGRVGDHARQHEPDGDGEDGDRHEDVREHGDQLGALGVPVPDGQQVAGAVERHDRDHRAGSLKCRERRRPGMPARRRSSRRRHAYSAAPE